MPIGYQQFGGLCDLEKSTTRSIERHKFQNQINQFIKNLKNHVDLDYDIDMYSLKNFYTNSLPPSISDGMYYY